ncbi:MAG TPA: ORF6N domain-containing protein [Pyrinomonadaceae bacterium]|nr:ORF6N domain-containing protein [Pyrinomonadaceae bacterium]
MTKSDLILAERIANSIYFIRGERVMLDRDLAALYGVETKVLKQAVKRNIDRFPEDFMFVLNQVEFRNWRSQFVTSKGDRQGLRYPPMAFTEHGIVMLSSVLNSKRAIDVNIEITRAFVKLRKILASHAELARRLDELEKKYDKRFKAVFDAIRTLMSPSPVKRKQIGFRQQVK